MFGRKKADVVVAGAGPVGLFSALTLAERGVRVRVIDKEWRTGTRSYALALHPESLEMFEELGLLAPVLERAYHVRSVGLYDRQERRDELRISELPRDYSFAAVIQQCELERIFEQALRAHGVEVEWCRAVSALEQTDSGVRVRVDKLTKENLGYIVPHTEWVVSKSTEWDVPYLIGADGHASRVRSALDIGFPAVGAASNFAVFEFETDADPRHEMAVVLDGTTDVCWPLPGGLCRWSFQIPAFETLDDTREKDRELAQLIEQRDPELCEEHLRELLAERAPWFRGSVGPIRWRMIVRFERRLAESCGRGRVWLAGDAVHLTGPAGVQSMNVGFREARELTDIVRGALCGDPVEADFAAYDRGRQAEWRMLLGLDDALLPTTRAEPWIAQRRAALLPCIPASGEDLARLAGQVGLRAAVEAGAA